MNRRTRRLVRNMAGGAIGGLVASYAMNQFQTASSKIEERVSSKPKSAKETEEQSEEDDATVKTCNSFQEIVGSRAISFAKETGRRHRSLRLWDADGRDLWLARGTSATCSARLRRAVRQCGMAHSGCDCGSGTRPWGAAAKSADFLACAGACGTPGLRSDHRQRSPTRYPLNLGMQRLE